MRFPVMPLLETKDGVSNKNARMTNVLRERNKAVIRPGLSAVLDYAGLGAGLIPFNGRLISLFGDTVYVPNDLDAAPDAAFPLDSGTYSASTTYTFGDSVWYNGALWFSIADANTGNTPAAGAWWARAYPPAWNSGYTYPAGAFVNYGGYLWYSLVGNNTNNTPTVGAYWDSHNPPASEYEFVLTADSGEMPVQRGFAIAGFVNGQIGSIAPSELLGLTIGVLCSDNTNTYFLVSGSQDQSLFYSIRFYLADPPIDYTAYSADAAISSVNIGVNPYTQFYWADFDPLGPTGDYQITVAQSAP